MKEKKYKEQYRLVDEMDDRGHVKRRAVYTGSYFAWQATPEQQKACRVLWLASMLAALAAILGYLLLNTPGSRCLYVLPILILGLFPAAYGCMGAVHVFTQPQRMTMVQRENGVGRVVRSAFGLVLASSLSLLGDLILLYQLEETASELPGTLLIAVSCAAAWVCFLSVRKAWHQVRELPRQAE